MDNETGFLSVISDQNLESLLTPQEKAIVGEKLWAALARSADSLSQGASTSLRVETAQALLTSVCFVLRQGLVKDGLENDIRGQLVTGDYDALFKAGLKVLEGKIQTARVLYEKVCDSALPVENLAYHDSLRELGLFFKRYHIHHGAHDIPCMLDYPLARPVEEHLLGIDYIYEYLSRLAIENDFCQRFAPELVTALLRRISPFYKDDLLNIYEAVAANSVALTLIGDEALALDITERDRRRLTVFFQNKSPESARLALGDAARALCVQLGIQADADQQYLSRLATGLYDRIELSLKLDRLAAVFPSLDKGTAEIKRSRRYIDNAPMADEQLRELIDDLADCRLLSDKIVLVSERVRSIRDLMEVLGISFWGAECAAVLQALGPDTCQLLTETVGQKKSQFPNWSSETGWETYLQVEKPQ